MRRKQGELVPLEKFIVEAIRQLQNRGYKQVYGIIIAKELQELQNSKSLIAHGTLYRALDRLEKMGYLDSVWENPDTWVDEHRPRRRFYELKIKEEK